jgi:hypothetical protein
MSLDHEPGQGRRDSLSELSPELRRRLAALDEPVSRANWTDVLRRDRRSRVGGGKVAVIAAALLAAVSAAAVAWIAPARDYEKALRSAGPTQAVHQSNGALLIAPRAIPSRTRAIAPTAPVGGNPSSPILYVSPARGGGICFAWTGSPGRCVQLRSSLFSLAWETPHLVVGAISSRAFSTVQVRFTDGTTIRHAVSWVVAPVRAGFFYCRVPPGKTVATINMV